MPCAHCHKKWEAGARPFMLCGVCYSATFCHRDCLRRGHCKEACAKAVAIIKGSNPLDLERCVLKDETGLLLRGLGTEAVETATAVLLDPFEQTKTVVQLPLSRHQVVEACSGLQLTDLWPEPQTLAGVMRWPPPKAVGEWTPDRRKLTACKGDGVYVAALVTYSLTCSRAVDKAPGVTIRTSDDPAHAARTFVGRVLLVSGRDVYDRRGNNFERLLPLTPAARALAEAGCEFVSAREAQRRREAETAVVAAGALEQAARVNLRLEVKTAAPMVREGTCFTCGAASAATKKCAGCSHARYCSRECQVAHWRAGHREACSRLSS